MEAWFNFGVVGVAALLLFIACAIFEKRISDVPQLFLIGISAGTALGLLSDYVLSGIFSYVLGYGLFYLVFNAAVIYGLFTATVLLLQKASFTDFIFWIIAMAVVYETTNYFFPVWAYRISSPPEWLAFVLVGNVATALFIALIGHLFFGYRFQSIANLTKR